MHCCPGTVHGRLPRNISAPSVISNTSIASDVYSSVGSEGSCSSDDVPTPTVVCTAMRQLETHGTDRHDGHQVWQGRTRSQTCALQQQSEGARLVAILGPNQRGQMVHVLAAITGVEPESTNCAGACNSQDVEVWQKSIDAEWVFK